MIESKRQQIYDYVANILAQALQKPEFDALVEALEYENEGWTVNLRSTLQTIQNSAVVVQGKVAEAGPEEIVPAEPECQGCASDRHYPFLPPTHHTCGKLETT